MRKFIPLLSVAALAACVGSYTPPVDQTGVDHQKFASDLQACRDEAIQKRDANYWDALGKSMVPGLGLAQYFDDENPSSFPGQHKNVDRCMVARGYRMEAGHE